MSVHPWRRGALPFQVAAVVWLTLVWIGLWGTLTIANTLAGLGIALLVVRGLPMPAIDYHGHVRPGRLLALIVRVAFDLVVASTQVAMLALGPRTPQSAVIRVPLRSQSDLYLTLTAQIVSLVPGTVVVEAHRVSGTLYVHVLDVVRTGVEEHRREVMAIEERVLWALASIDELDRAGLTSPDEPIGVGRPRARFRRRSGPGASSTRSEEAR